MRARVGLMDGPRFRTAVREAIATLAGHVSLPQARIEAVLPPDLLDALGVGALAPGDPTTAYLRVATAARMHVSVAIEVLRAVLAELSARLGPEGRDELRGVLPRDWAELVVDPSRARADGSRD